MFHIEKRRWSPPPPPFSANELCRLSPRVCLVGSEHVGRDASGRFVFNPRTCPVNISLAATQALGARQKQAPAVYRAACSIMNYCWEALWSPLNYAQVDSDSLPPGFPSAGSSKAKSEPLFQTKGRGNPFLRIQIKIFAGFLDL